MRLTGALSAAEGDNTTLVATRKDLWAILHENIVPFWWQVVDSTYGGYSLNHDRKGRWRGPVPKRLVTQARMLWFFSRLSLELTPPRRERALAAATAGFSFLHDVMWDAAGGGFFWEVSASGEPNIKLKRPYGQAFALFALAEYARATSLESALSLAGVAFDYLEHHFHADAFGGYFELPGDVGAPLVETQRRDNKPVKRMNTHLHLMEAFVAYSRCTDEPLVRERLGELLAIQTGAVIHQQVGACADFFARDWTPLQNRHTNRVSFGHDVENAGLSLDALEVVGAGEAAVLDACSAMSRNALRFGFDWKQGGFYESGPLGKYADRKWKTWWVQAEGLLSSLKMFRRTGDPIYLDCYGLTLEWILSHQVDWKHGEWFEVVSSRGRKSGKKAGSWKSAYHNGRAMIEGLAILESLRG
jgi:mannobiose 2-epimerase